MGMRITELSDIMGISRPTLYKFMDMYGRGDRDGIDADVLKLFDRIKRDPRIGRKDVLYYLLLLRGGRDADICRVPATVTVTAVERPARRLIMLRSTNADDYMSYCEEKGCDWEGTLNSIPDRYDDAAVVSLPPSLMKEGTSGTASGVEVPSNYCGDIPDGYEIVDLPGCTMLYFCGSEYHDEEDFCDAIKIVSDALISYRPERFGWILDHGAAPSFNFGASAEKGARMAVPVRNIL
jgi:hypothetical protein